MPYRLIPVENTPLDRAQIARVLVTANYEDDYFRTVYSFSPLPFLIENARLRLGSNLLNSRAWFMKTVSTEDDDRDHSRAQAPATADTFADGKEGDRRRGVSDTEHGKGEGIVEIVSYSRWLLPPEVKEKLEKEFPRVKLSQSELEQLDAQRRLGCDSNGEPIGLNEQMLDEVGQTMESARTAFPSHQPHMTLDLLATLPSHQRRGLATAHVKWGVELADREGLPVFLESTPSGKGIYEKFGFKEVSSATHDLPKWGGDGLYTHVFMVREPQGSRGASGLRLA